MISNTRVFLQFFFLLLYKSIVFKSVFFWHKIHINLSRDFVDQFISSSSIAINRNYFEMSCPNRGGLCKLHQPTSILIRIVNSS